MPFGKTLQMNAIDNEVKARRIFRFPMPEHEPTTRQQIRSAEFERDRSLRGKARVRARRKR